MPKDQIEKDQNKGGEDTHLDQIKNDIALLKKDAQALDNKVADFEKNKDKLSKEETDNLKKEIEEEGKRIEAKKQELLATLRQIKGELTTLKKSMGVSVNTSELEGFEKEIQSIKLKQSNGWLKRQWNGVLNEEEWKNHPLKNVARLAGGIGVIALAWQGIKSLFSIGKDKSGTNENTNNDKEKGEKKKPWWKKALIGMGILGGTIGVGILGYKYWPEIKGWFLDLIGENLTFEEAMIKVKSDLGGVSESDLNVALNLDYDENRSVITSYGEEIKIDKKKKRVEGLDVSFSNYEEMIHAANIINYAKTTYKGKCVSKTPFYITSFGGDIEVRLLDDYQKEVITGEGVPVGAIVGGVVGSIGALVAGYYAGPRAGIVTGLGSVPAGIALGHYVGDGRSTLAKICPKLADGIGKEKLLTCLNSLPNLTQGDQTLESNTKTPLQKYVNEVIKEIKNTEFDGEFDQQGNARDLKAEIDPNDKTCYIIKSWGRLGQTKIQFIEGNYIKIEGLDIEFTDIKEGIRVANLTNKIRNEYAGKCTKKPFSYKAGLTTFGEAGLYATDGRTNWNPSHMIPYRIISKEMLESRYPTLLQNIETKYIPYLHKMKTENNRSLRIIPNK